MREKIRQLGRRVSPLNFFVITAAVFGMAFVLITPPLEGADEIVHFYRAYQISGGNIIADKSADGKVGGQLPVSLSEIATKTESPLIMFHPELKYNERLTVDALRIPNNQHKTKFTEFAPAAPYSPASYLGSIPAMAFARLLHLPNMVVFYAGRAGSLLAWIVLIGAAIYYLPRRKWLMVAVGLLPMALFQASMINGDGMTFGSLALFIALILHFREKVGRLTKSELALLVLVAIVMTLSKQVMFLFLPLVLLIKKDKFALPSRYKTWLYRAALIGIPLLCFVLWMFATRDVNSTSATVYGNGQSPQQQVRFIVEHPHSYINVLWNTFFYTWGDGVTRSFVGTFGWMDAPLSELIVTIGYIGLALLFFATNEKEKAEWLQKKERLVLWGAVVLYWLAVCTALYVTYSPYRYKIAYGLQGRYFLPMLLLAIPLLATKHIRIDTRLYRRVAVALPIFLLVASTITITVRYFFVNV